MTYSNRLPPPRPLTKTEMQEVIDKVRDHFNRKIQLEPTKFVLPPDWETKFSPELVAEIKRQLGDT